MTRRWISGDLGSHPDVYGRMRWDAPAPTIKRECAHVGNGRYAHPVEDRLLTVREMASLQGFPFDYAFPSRSIANRRSEEHTSELQSLMRISYAVFCLKKKNTI